MEISTIPMALHDLAQWVSIRQLLAYFLGKGGVDPGIVYAL